MLNQQGENTPSFRELAERIILGDAAAADLLVREYTGPSVHTLMVECGFSLNTAHDVAQDTIWSVISKLRSGELSTPDKLPRGTEWFWTCLKRNGTDKVRDKIVQRRVEGGCLDDADRMCDPAARRPLSILGEREQRELSEGVQKYALEECDKVTGRAREILDLYRSGVRLVEIAQKLDMDETTCRSLFYRTCDRIFANAQARALNLDVPEEKPVTRESLQDVFRRLPEHQRKIAQFACLYGLAERPDEIARLTKYRLQLVQTNLAQIWRLLSRRFHRDFPEALQLLKEEDDEETTPPPWEAK